MNSSTLSSASSTSTINNKRKYPSSPSQEEALKPEGTIQLEIENFAKFGHSRIGTERHSEAVFIRGLPWKLHVGIQKDDKAEKVLNYYVAWDISNNEDSDYHGLIYMSGEIRLLAQMAGKDHIVKPFYKYTNRCCDKTGFGHIESIGYIMKSENGWYDPKCDTVILEADVRSSLPRGSKKLTITAQEAQRSEAFKNRMKDLLGTGKAADVQFLVGKDEEPLAAHKLFLISASTKFEELFNNNKIGDKPIKVPDIDLGAFRVMLDYIYTGDPQGLDWDNLFGVLHAAKKFEVNGLYYICLNWVSDLKMDKDQVLILLEQARFYEEQAFLYSNCLKAFTDYCWRYTDQNIYAVITSQTFLGIGIKLLEELFARDTLAMSKWPEGELALWNAALRWADEQCRQRGLICCGENRRRMLGTALYKIRMPLIDRKILKEKIVPSGVLTKDEVISLVFCKLNPDPAAFIDSVRMFGLEDQFQLNFPTGKRA